MSGRVSFLLAGCAHPHARAHLRTLQLLPEVEAIHLWDPDAEAAAAVARAMPDKVSATSTDLDACLSREETGFVLLAVPNDVSPGIIARCAAAGKHVLAEKPLAVDAGHLLPALAAARQAGVVLGVCYQNRSHPVVTDVRRLLSAGAVGRPLTVEVRMVTSQVRYRDPSHWLFRKEVAGGGILSWLGCHYIDLVRYALGEEIAEVMAMAGTLSGEAITVEDAACFCFQTASGALGSFHAGYLMPRSVSGYMGPSYDTYLALRGATGSLRWEPFAKPPVLHVESTEGDLEAAPARTLTYELPESEAYGGAHGEQFVRDFIAAARSGGTPPASGEDGLDVLQVLDAVYESARTGRRTPVRRG